MEGKISIIKAGQVTDQAKILRRTSVFGSGEKCQVRIKSTRVAPELAELAFHSGKVLFKRLALMGDLFRNDLPICAHVGDMVELFDGDKLKIGTTEFKWTLIDPTAAKPEEVKKEVAKPSKEAPSTELVTKGLSERPLSPQRVTRSSQGKSSPKKEPKKEAKAAVIERTQEESASRRTSQAFGVEDQPKGKAKTSDSSSQSEKAKIPKSPVVRQKSRKENSEESKEFDEAMQEVRLTRRLSKEPSVMIMEKKKAAKEKESDTADKESQSQARGSDRISTSIANRKRKREESEEDLRAAERYRHVKTRRLSSQKNDERVFEPNPMQSKEIEELLIPILLKALEDTAEATIFDFEEAVRANPKVSRTLLEEELNVRDQIYQTLVGNMDRFAPGDLVRKGFKSAMSWRAASAQPNPKKTKISAKEARLKEAQPPPKPSLSSNLSEATKKGPLPKKHSATTEDKMEEASKEASEESKEVEAEQKPKKPEPKRQESKTAAVAPQPPLPSASLTNDPMEIEMDMAVEFKKIEKEIRALVSADVKKAKELKEAGTLPKWEPDETAKKQAKADLRNFPKSQVQGLLLFLIKKFMSQSHNFELDDEENCYSDHVEHHWLPVFAKLILSSRS